jgi:hypothetical protein
MKTVHVVKIRKSNITSIIKLLYTVKVADSSLENPPNILMHVLIVNNNKKFWEELTPTFHHTTRPH